MRAALYGLAAAIWTRDITTAHRAARALEQLLGRSPLLTQAAELAEARLENALFAGAGAPLGLDAAVKRRQIAARPECRLELLRLPPRVRDDPALLEDDGPRCHGGTQKYQHDPLHDGARIEHQGPDRQVIAHYATP